LSDETFKIGKSEEKRASDRHLEERKSITPSKMSGATLWKRRKKKFQEKGSRATIDRGPKRF